MYNGEKANPLPNCQSAKSAIVVHTEYWRQVMTTPQPRQLGVVATPQIRKLGV
jgi:hypothetical protein